MGFEVVHGSPLKIWCPVDMADTGTETLYVGQLVRAGSDGVLNLGQASGIADLTNKVVPFGVVTGTNNKTPVFNSTYKANYITSAGSQTAQNARDFRMVEGVWSKGDPQAFVEVALIDCTTIIRGHLFDTTYGVAPDVLTATTAGTGDGMITADSVLSTCTFTPVADLCTIYCRTGANAGIYRITVDSSTTVPQVDVAFPYDVTVGDTFIRVPYRPIGISYAQTDTEATFFDCISSPATNYFVIDVIKLDLSVAGNEHLLFRFNPIHFDPVTYRHSA